jgi:hypothetical protein
MWVFKRLQWYFYPLWRVQIIKAKYFQRQNMTSRATPFYAYTPQGDTKSYSAANMHKIIWRLLL